MKAVMYEAYEGQPKMVNLPDPTPPAHGVVLRTMATGLCRSDWHGWMGHDPDIELPHVPGHEIAGIVEAVGKDVKNWKPGDRVTLPFVCGCSTCPQCLSGNHQVCDHQFQPGFTHWGSFAEFVAIHYADTNLVSLPVDLDYVTAASLGCRFVTSFRALVAQGRVTAGQWVAVHGCGGVGLSAIMIASALGARVVAVDIDEDKLTLAESVGADMLVNAANEKDVVGQIMEITRGGAHVSIDALGNPETCFNSIANLRKRGKHVQVGLMLADQSRPAIPMDRVIAFELEILGSHGIQAFEYPAVLAMIESGKLSPEKLIGKTITLEESITALMDMNSFSNTGVIVIDRL